MKCTIVLQQLVLKKVYPAIRQRPVTRLLYLVPRIEMLLRVLSAYNLHSAKIRKLMLSFKYLHVVANLPITSLVQRYHRKTCNKVVQCRFLAITMRHGSSAHQVLEVPYICFTFFSNKLFRIMEHTRVRSEESVFAFISMIFFFILDTGTGTCYQVLF